MFSFLKKNRKTQLTSKQEAAVKAIMNKTGWSRKKTIANINEAHNNCGIKYGEYNKYNFYKISKEEQIEKYKELQSKAQRIRERRKLAIESVMAKTGWTREETESHMIEAKKLCGISFYKYNRYNFFRVERCNQKEKYEAILLEEARLKGEREREAEEEKALQEEATNRHYIQKTMEVTGWSYEEAVAQIEHAKERKGCLHQEYYLYKLYELDETKWDDYFLGVDSIKLRKKYDTDKKMGPITNNKELTNQYFQKYIKRPWSINTDISLDEFKKLFRGCEKVIYKPVRGHKGTGIETFMIDENSIETLFRQIACLPKGVIEKCVIQHPILNELNPYSVNTIRIVTISSKTVPVLKDGSMMDIAYAALRIGGGTSIVDNFSSGGMVAGIDLKTGTLITDAVDGEGTVFKEHPLTGATIKGFKVPLFEEAKGLVLDAIELTEASGYLGWDIAIGADDPELIEINLNPGINLLSLPYAADGIGMKHVMDKYI